MFNNSLNLSAIKKSLTANRNKSIKIASLGNFSEVLTQDHGKFFAKLSSELVQLPQYQNLISKLSSATGIVNFVTGEEWEPLTEMIVKKAFPPFNSDIYHAIYKDKALPEDNHVSARAMWGTDKASMQDKMAAAEDFNENITGLPLVQSWIELEKNGVLQDVKYSRLSDADKSKYIKFSDWAKSSPEWRATCTNEEGQFNVNLGTEKLDLLKTELKELETSPVAKRLNILKQELINEYNLRHSTNVDENEKIVSDEQFDTMKSQYRELTKSLENEKKRIIKNCGIPPVKLPNGKIQRDKSSGFINYNPSANFEKIIKEYNSLNEQILLSRKRPDFAQNIPEHEKRIKNIYSSLQRAIEDYKTLDKSLITIQKQILAITKGLPPSIPDKPTALIDYNHNIFGNLTKLIKEYENKLTNHGQVMIVTDVDFSSFNLEKDESSKLKNSIYHALDNFSVTYNSQLEKNRSQGKLSNKKTILLISKNPISDIPQVVTVDLTQIVLDEQAARVLTKDLLESYIKYIINNKNTINYLVKEKINNKKPLNNYQKVNLTGLDLDEDLIGKFAGLVQGMNVKNAFSVLDNSIKSNINKTIDEEENSILDINLNLDDVEKTIEKKLGEIPSAIGLKVRKPDLSNFDNYMYDADTKWGQNVSQFKNIKDLLNATNFQIKSLQENIKKSNALLVSTKEETTKKQLTLQINNLKEQLKSAQFQKNNILAPMPHIFILYGAPGVGKSVWSDALASLFNFQIMQINFSEGRNKWLGDTEKQQRELISRIKEARNTVFLLDELNKDVGMKSGGQGDSSASTGGDKHDNSLVSQLLQFLQSSKNSFREKNVFVIVTTNQPNEIDTAFLERSDLTQKVEPPQNPEAYLKFFDTYLKDEKQKAPNAPWYIYGSKNNAEAWDNTIKLIKSLDLKSLADKCVQKQLNFRFVGGVLREAVNKHVAFMISKENNEIGGSMDIVGVPLTNANMQRAAERCSSASVGEGKADNTAYDRGFDEIALENKKAAEQFKGMKPTVVINPETGNPETKYEFNKNYLKIMGGEYGNYDTIETDVGMQVERYTKISAELNNVNSEIEKILETSKGMHWQDPKYKKLELQRSELQNEINRIKKLHPYIAQQSKVQIVKNPEDTSDFLKLLNKDFKSKKDQSIDESNDVDNLDEELVSGKNTKVDFKDKKKDLGIEKDNVIESSANSTDYYFGKLAKLKKTAQEAEAMELLEPTGFYSYEGGSIMMMPIPGASPHLFRNKKKGI